MLKEIIKYRFALIFILTLSCNNNNTSNKKNSYEKINYSKVILNSKSSKINIETEFIIQKNYFKRNIRYYKDTSENKKDDLDILDQFIDIYN